MGTVKALWGTLFVRKTQNCTLQFFRYGLVSCAALLVDFGGMILLTELVGVHYILAAALSFTAGLAVSYALSVRWVFKSSRLINQRDEFVIFASIGIVGLLLTAFLLWLFTDITGLHYIISKMITTIVVYFWNFGARKKILFN